MTHRSGSADLPLHHGRVPAWLGQRMTRLGVVITQAIVHHYGRDEFLRRLAHPFWFQSFGAVMGMDWHSSGITTSVIGALKRGLEPLAGELGLHVCGGRGEHSRKTPHELLRIGEHTGLNGAALVTASRLVAKVDSAAVQDGYDPYLHGFILADDGKWVVVQQGMNGDTRCARRYHWHSEGLKSFVEAPHAAIDGENQGEIINLTDRKAAASRAQDPDVAGLRARHNRHGWDDLVLWIGLALEDHVDLADRETGQRQVEIDIHDGQFGELELQQIEVSNASSTSRRDKRQIPASTSSAQRSIPTTRTPRC